MSVWPLLEKRISSDIKAFENIGRPTCRRGRNLGNSSNKSIQGRDLLTNDRMMQKPVMNQKRRLKSTFKVTIFRNSQIFANGAREN